MISRGYICVWIGCHPSNFPLEENFKEAIKYLPPFETDICLDYYEKIADVYFVGEFKS